ncbi:hypothetical protein GW933_03040 [Candidatus Falkowbacteria bacterium]|uniref:Sulfotransferase domain-containing protein n=1 Tax=Candidatus Buchananbacteria bacterium CG10_big_fil_rev_8_21_14_0_10_33_19 TaxID=1974525 RepID=A0A2H0W4K1_9BACT|nr:hypothetical protein [Candidatus Falkowbacteria bacterium]PIS06282.1 MAG: hypothetical protein COT80_01795 [Candidatus Buchananbacteria bacterium CG10_big_fil_rev_8_21_14_0_10_33_19]
MDYDKNNENIIYVFLHIPKTGGITLRYHIEKNFKKNEFLLLYRSADAGLVNKEAVNKHILAMPDNQRHKLKIIYGHEVYYGIHELFPNRTVRYITFFRSPFQLFSSFYNFSKYKIDHNNEWFKIEGRPQLLKDNDNYDLDKLICTRDNLDLAYQFLVARFLTDDFRTNYDYPENIVSLEKIKNILNKFYFIGLAEESEDFLFIYKKLGINKFFVNRNKTKKSYFNSNDLQIKQQIKSKMQFDARLYEYAFEINKYFKKNSKDFYKLTEDSASLNFIKVLYFIPDLLSNIVYNILRKFGLINLVEYYVYGQKNNMK